MHNPKVTKATNRLISVVQKSADAQTDNHPDTRANGKHDKLVSHGRFSINRSSFPSMRSSCVCNRETTSPSVLSWRSSRSCCVATRDFKISTSFFMSATAQITMAAWISRAKIRLNGTFLSRCHDSFVGALMGQSFS